MKIEEGEKYQVIMRNYKRKDGQPVYGETYSKVVGWKPAARVAKIIENVRHVLNRNKIE